MQRAYTSPIGNELTCKNWEIEGLLRLFLNSLDPRVAENSKDLVVYGGEGKAARNEEAVHAIIQSLQTLEEDETLLIQSGKPVGKFRTFKEAPRIVNASSILVPAYSDDEHFQALVQKNLMMYGQSTAASWAYIGVQGILQGTFETMGEIADQHFHGTLAGKIVLTSGLGGMSAAQPLSVTMHGGVCIVVEVSEEKIDKRLLSNYCDLKVQTMEEAIVLAKEAAEARKPLAIAVVGNAATCYRYALDAHFIPDIVTDQTSAHDVTYGYVPSGLTVEQTKILRSKHKKHYEALVKETIMEHVEAMLQFQKHGAIVFEYGNNIRQQAYQLGVQHALQIRGFTEAYLRPLYCEGRGPCRWIALSGNPDDIYTIDDMILQKFAHDERVKRWIEFVQEKIYFYGLPARTCWLNYEERKEIGVLVNEMVQTGELSGPIAFTRDHSEGSTMAAPFRETEKMLDGSDIVADWPILNAMLNTSAGASMVSIQNGGGMGIGNSVHSGMTVIADGTIEATDRLRHVLAVDPKMNMIRHADAGYKKAIDLLEKMEGE
ncbi:urocanate hydratase [Pseudogracilibacillus sp. ICA-222130]|uniref:urocanate hydratase n=1 Tax=Pseudogracilibacillus sp. ICA-222130 TaxID=3134655 RepID=UPI0030BDD131